MTDLMDRLAAANPAYETEQPSLDDVWRKIDADAAEVGGGTRRGRLGLVAAVAAVPVLAVVLIAIGARGRPHAPPRHAEKGVRGALSTINPAAQRSAVRALGRRSGTVVVMDPRTGAIEAMAASGAWHARNQAGVPPGATFDVVTLATALGSGRYGPGSRVSGASPFGAPGARVRNDEGQSYGPLTLSDALTFSVNTAFARVGTAVGSAALTRQMRLFQLSSPGGPGETVALGPLAAGQGSVTVTPVQLAAIAATIANGGRLAEPHAAALAGPTPVRRVMAPRTAQLLTQMLRRVVTQGTGTAVNLPGLDIAGKTGTASLGQAGDTAAGGGGPGTVASFIGFAPARHPTVAVAVVLRVPHGGFGGTEAAPIAGQVIRDVLRAHP
jgi:peptidoglycan glycosyltransferase